MGKVIFSWRKHDIDMFQISVNWEVSIVALKFTIHLWNTINQCLNKEIRCQNLKNLMFGLSLTPKIWCFFLNVYRLNIFVDFSLKITTDWKKIGIIKNDIILERIDELKNKHFSF